MSAEHLWELGILAVSLVLIAFFSASETALTALPEAKTRQLVEAANGRSLLNIWLKAPERVLATLLVGNTVASVGSSALATSIVESMGLPHGVAIATGVMTLVVLLFGEITPKTFAKRHSERVARLLMPLVWLLCLLLYPLAQLIVGLTTRIVPKAHGGKAAPSTTAEEIEYLIDLGTREGVLDEVKEELLNSVLEFADLTVKEIMVSRTQVVAIDKAMSFEEVMKLVNEAEHSRLPVYEESVDNVLGVINIKDILKDLHRTEPATFTLDKYLRAPFFVPEVMKISRLLKEFQKRKTHLAVVVDEFGGTSGIVTLEDVVEEIVGEIQDEHDVEEKPVKQVAPGRYIAEGSVSLRALEETLGVTFPEEGDYETLGGFLTATAGRVPQPGAHIAWDGLNFAVRAGDDRRVLKVEIVRAEPDKAAAASATAPAPPTSQPPPVTTPVAVRQLDDGGHPHKNGTR
ncbi:MAG: HlyC/CorC family transporter [Deltaproteobacteria bacterium]|nr:HlyC/CorC family transporter [Deltaproteobacteria bacterium]